MVEQCLDRLGALGLLKCNILIYVDNQSGERFWKKGGWFDRNELKLLQHDIGAPTGEIPEQRGLPRAERPHS
jgi:hypothetical protein